MRKYKKTPKKSSATMTRWIHRIWTGLLDKQD